MKLSEVKAGDVLVADSGFTCLREGHHTVDRDDIGLFIKCDDGKHYLDGQTDFATGTELVGLKK